MKKIVSGCLLLLAGATWAGEYKPYVMVDASSEKNSIADEYIGANITMGAKTADKMDYSVKVGVSSKDAASGSGNISNNIEFKVKKTFDVGMFFMPYVSARLGQKLNYNTTNFTHYSLDLGARMPVSGGLSLDVGYRYRNAFDSSQDYRSNRYHAMFLYDFDEHNTVGLRYASSFAHSTTEDRDSWRVHYQRNY